MAAAKRLGLDRIERVGVHSARTAVAAAASLEVARIFRLPEAYWAGWPTLCLDVPAHVPAELPL